MCESILAGTRRLCARENLGEHALEGHSTHREASANNRDIRFDDSPHCGANGPYDVSISNHPLSFRPAEKFEVEECTRVVLTRWIWALGSRIQRRHPEHTCDNYTEIFSEYISFWVGELQKTDKNPRAKTNISDNFWLRRSFKLYITGIGRVRMRMSPSIEKPALAYQNIVVFRQ